MTLMIGEYKLSEEVYVVNKRRSGNVANDYVTGTHVRMISGVDNSDVPGYHFSEGWVTVCRIDAKHPEWAGLKKTWLTKVKRK